MRLLLIALIILPMVAMTQINQSNLLQKNCPPARLKQVLVRQSAFNPFPRSKEQWQKFLPDTVLQQIIRNGTDVMNEPFPSIPASVALDFIRNGNRTRYEDILFGKRDRLWKLLLAESMEGNKRFLPAIVDGIWSIAEESFWGTSAHLFIQKAGIGLPDVEDPAVDLFAAETAATLALADYLIAEQLDSVSPLIRRRIYHEVNRRVFVPLQRAKYDWMGSGDKHAKLNNWVPWIFSNYLTACLLLEKDQVKRVQYVSMAMRFTDQYVNGFGEDGATEEGPGYWNFGAGCVFGILNLLTNASNGAINIFDQNIIRRMGAYIYETHIDNYYFVNLADTRPEVYPEAIMVWRFGKSVSDRHLRNFGAWLFGRTPYLNTINPTFHRARALYDLMSLRDIASEKQTYQPVNHAWLPDVQLMTARLNNGLYVAAHGGHNGESHNHNDVGDFIVYANGDPVIIDVGAGTYTSKTFSKDRYKLWFNTSAYHNLPAINGQQQLEGKNYGAMQVGYLRSNDRTIFSLNLENAYSLVSGPAKWRRTIVAGPATIVINDSFQLIKPSNTVTQSFMTVCKVDIGEVGKIVFITPNGTRVSLHYGEGWEISKEEIPLTTEEEQGLKVTWKSLPITRILLSQKTSTIQGKSRYEISIEQ